LQAGLQKRAKVQNRIEAQRTMQMYSSEQGVGEEWQLESQVSGGMQLFEAEHFATASPLGFYQLLRRRAASLFTGQPKKPL